MKEEKHEETLKEVLEEVETALKDERGILSHQRRLAFSLSLGASNLLEIYFHKLNIKKTLSFYRTLKGAVCSLGFLDSQKNLTVALQLSAT